MDTKTKVRKIIRLLEKEYPQAKTTLRYRDPFELFVLALLSTQTSDEHVNRIAPSLFARFRKPEDFARASIEEIASYIRSIGLWKTKARNLKRACEILVNLFDSKVPERMEDLILLPGIGRKVASVILYTAYGKNEGIPIDTHNRRLIRRLGLSKEAQQDRIERDMMKIVPREKWGEFSLLLIYHGRRICSSRNPKCRECVLNKICPSAFKIGH